MASARELSRNSDGYFTVDDVKGEELDYIIRDVVVREVGKDKDQKQVVTLEGTPRAVILNKTRLTQLIDQFGDADLKGQGITLFVDDVDVAGRTHTMICLRATDSADG